MGPGSGGSAAIWRPTWSSSTTSARGLSASDRARNLYELIGERVGRDSTIVISNPPPQDWYALFPNPVLAEGALDRLINAAHHVTLQGKSYRPQQRPDRAEEATAKKG